MKPKTKAENVKMKLSSVLLRLQLLEKELPEAKSELEELGKQIKYVVESKEIKGA